MSATLLNERQTTSFGQAFNWNEVRSKAACLLASGYSKQEVADELQIARSTIYEWLNYPEFDAEVDRLSLMVGIASRAERLRLVNRVIRQHVRSSGEIITEKDILDWLKFAQSETSGAKIDLSKLAEMLTEEQAQDNPRQLADHNTLADQSSPTSSDNPVIEAEVGSGNNDSNEQLNPS